MKNSFSEASFDELIKNHYGFSGLSSPDNNTKEVEDIFANYYGKLTRQRDKKGNKPSPVVFSLSFDDGEILSQYQKDKGVEEYVIQKAIADPMFEEYVVGDCILSSEKSVGSRVEDLPSDEKVSASQEYRVDVLDPLKKESIQTSATATVADDSPSKTPMPLGFAQQVTTVEKQPQPLFDETSRAKVTNEDFAADLQAILTGKSVFDPKTRTTVRKDELGNQTIASGRDVDNTLSTSESNNRQAIFDQIAQSMQYANKYDLGTIELSNRFSDFDKIIELQERTGEEKKSRNRQTIPSVSQPEATVNTADFMQDMDNIQKDHLPPISTKSEIPTKSFLTDTETKTATNTDTEIKNVNQAEIAEKTG